MSPAVQRTAGGHTLGKSASCNCRRRLLLKRRPRLFQRLVATARSCPAVTPCFLATSDVEQPNARSLAISFIRLVKCCEPGTDIHLRSDLIGNRRPLVLDHRVDPVTWLALDLDVIADLSVRSKAAPCRSCGQLLAGHALRAANCTKPGSMGLRPPLGLVHAIEHRPRGNAQLPLQSHPHVPRDPDDKRRGGVFARSRGAWRRSLIASVVSLRSLLIAIMGRPPN